MNFKLIKREKSSDLILDLMIWALFAILMMRAYLYVMGNPTVSFGEWHIAHMLWGGLLMIVGFVVVVLFAGRKVMRLAVAIEGIGWGLFVDEIGKFLTKDNNYWFRPAIIFIYVSFVLMFILYRYLSKSKKETKESKLFSLIDSLEEIVNDDLELGERTVYIQKANELIAEADDEDVKTVASSILKVLKSKKGKEDKNNWKDVIVGRIYAEVDRWLSRAIVRVVLWGYTIYWAIIKIIDTIWIVSSGNRLTLINQMFSGYVIAYSSDIFMISMKLIFDVTAAVFFVWGAVLFWIKKRKSGLSYFRVGFLISIFLSSIFKFYFEQFSAIFDFGISLFGYTVLERYKLKQSGK